MYKEKKKGIFGIVLTIIILIIIVIFSNNKQDLSFVENAISKIVNPIQKGLTYIKNGIIGNDTFFYDMDTLISENLELQEQNSELEQQVRELEYIKAENETLKEYMELTEKYGEYETIPGNVINKDISNYSKTIVINIGTDDGVEENMAVIADEGLVGYITSVTNNTANVKTIIDTSSSVSCVMSTTDEAIVCKGILDTNNNTLKAMYLPTDANVIQGDSIETSGLGEIYPKGIYIGKITSIVNTQNSTDRYALIETAVNFDELYTVLVVKQ